MRVKAVGKCPSGNLRFDTEARATEALEAARAYRIAKGETQMEKRWYPCHRCRGYHLTKQDKRKSPPVVT